jgi:hypothetical protein
MKRAVGMPFSATMRERRQATSDAVRQPPDVLLHDLIH